MPPKPKLNVTNFPRPPLLEKTPRHLQIKWDDVLIADTKDAYWVLETHHPPTYYLPRHSLLPLPHHQQPSQPSQQQPPLLKPTPNHHSTYCEYKGLATYHTLTHPTTHATVPNRIWSYESPTKPFEAIRGYLSFYAGGVPWSCWVDGEKVDAQEGAFYGGWVTGDVGGMMKGGRGTEGW